MKRVLMLASGLALTLAGLAVADTAAGSSAATPAILANVKPASPTGS